MSRRVIRFSLDLDSIEQAIREVDRYHDDFMKAANSVIRELSEKLGIEFQVVAIAEVEAVRNGGLSDGAYGYFDERNRVGYVQNHTYYAVFVEYGTGVVGEKSPYTGPAMPAFVTVNGYGPYTDYDTNEHGEEGWKYIGDSDGKLHWTQGQPSRPFFYNTFKKLIAAAPGVSRRIFGETLK